MPELKKLSLFSPLLSIPPTIVNSLTLLDVWQTALGYSVDSSAAKHERDAGSEKKNQARAELLPQVNANATYQKQSYSLFSNTQSRGWNVQATQVLFDRSLLAQYKQGKINAGTAGACLYGSEDELRMSVAKAYFDILLSKDKLAATTEEKSAYV